jgi:hypothetical protein
MHGREGAARFSSKLESGQGCLLNKTRIVIAETFTHALKICLKPISLRPFTTPALRLFIRNNARCPAS